MAEASTVLRRLSPLATQNTVSIGFLPPMTRITLRGEPDAARRVGEVFRAELSPDPLRANAAGARAALWLGPDEWLLLAPEQAGLAASIEAACDREHGCVIDVSHRQVGIEVRGTAGATVLNAGCPLNLDLKAFPVGMCTRTVLAKADIVLWRREPELFHVECWRSFAPYVLGVLKQASRDCGF